MTILGTDVRGVVFDLDGTLLDSAPDLQSALNAILEEDELEPLSLPVVTSFIGQGTRNLVRRGYDRAGQPVEGEALDAVLGRFEAVYFEHCTELTQPYPDAEATLQDLKERGLTLGVCTNKPYVLTMQILEGLDLAKFFEAVIGGDSCAARKPDPEPLHACLKGMGVEAAHALYVGDGETDVRTARAANVPVVLVEGGYTTTPVGALGADAVVAALKGLLD